MMYNPIPNRRRSLSCALILGLGVTLTFLWLLSAGPLPLVRAESFSVTKFTDSADGDCGTDCSLREAIIDANTNLENDIITLGTGTYVLTITGTNEDAAATGDLDITDVLTITGDGPGQTIIDANSIDRVFEIRPGAGTVVISGVTIINGNTTDNGGGIYNHDADLILINTDISSNTAEYGGGVYVYDWNATLSHTGTGAIAYNSATNGGGVYVSDGDVTLNGGQIHGNLTEYDGGGIYIYYGSATLNGGQIHDNSTTWGAGGGVYAWDGSVTLNGGEISSNTTTYGDGGGVYIFSGDLVLHEGQVFSNTAGYNGGGVCVDTGSAALNGGEIRGNYADRDGGGVYVYRGNATLSGGQILSNTAYNGDGGGVYVNDSIATFNQTGASTIAYNTTTYGDGGGVYIYGGSATLSDGQIRGNDADYGGGVYVDDYTGNVILNGVQIRNNDAWLGGGVYIYRGNATLSGGGILSNTAGFSGGGVYVQDLDATFVQTGTSTIAYNSTTDVSGSGGGVYIEFGSMTLGGGEIVHNSVNDFGGGVYVYDWSATFVQTGVSTIAYNYAEDYGGGVYVYDGSATLDGGQIYDNSAYDGGGVYVNDGSVTLNGGQIHDNTASNSGGGVYADFGSVTLNSGQIRDNSAADGSGGGVYNWWGNVTLNGGEILSNTADDAGGGMYMYENTLVQTGINVIAYNSARDGGGVYAETGDVTLSGGQIVSNSVTYYGGGVYVGSATFVQTGTSTIAYNSAQDGGGVYVGYGDATLNGGQIVGNSADYSGGGVYVYDSGATFTQTGASTITHNYAYAGGGVYVESGEAVLNGGQILDNSVYSHGGGVYVQAGNVTLSGGQIISNSAINGNSGGIYIASGSAKLSGGRIISNSGNYGGGMLVASGSATLDKMQISHNSSDDGGGGIYNAGGTLILTNTTFSHNAADGSSGGALYNQGGTATLIYVNVVSNTGDSLGDGIYRSGGVITLQNTLIAHNGVTNCGGGLTSNGHNLDSGDTCGLSAAGDRQNTDPLLGPLADNGGDTLTHALLPGSPAIDAGICLAGVTTDQRGEPRPNPANSFCDIGAYESDSTGTADLAIAKAVTPATVAPGDLLTYTLSFSNAGAAGTAGVVITDIVPVSVTVQSVISSGVSIVRTGSSTYTWQVSDMAPGHNGVITIAGTLNLGVPAGGLINTASITSTTVDTDTANNRSSAGVTVENVAPVADDATLFTDEDTPLHDMLPASDDNGEADILTFGIVTEPVSGSVTISGTGSFVYTPTENLYGTDFFVYVVTDTAGLADTATVTVHVNAVNDAPTNVSLSNANVAENQPSGTIVGDFSTADVDVGDAFTYTLVSGTGDTCNTSFTIVNDELRTAETFNYEAQITYTIRVSATDSGGLGHAEILTITVSDVNEAPTGVNLSNASVVENQPGGTAVGDFSTADVDVGDTFTYTLVSGLGDAGNASFTIVNDALRTAETFDYETQITYTIRVSATDSGGLDYAEILTITVTDANDAPVAVDDSAVTQKNVAVTIYVLGNDTDEDTGDILTVTAVGAPISGTVAISGSSEVVYTPTASSGTDTFTYTVSDGVQADTATVTVAVGDTVAWVDPGTGATLVYTDVLANVPVTVTIDVPGGAISDVIALIYDELSNSSHAPPAGFDFAGIIFVLDAYLDAVLQPGFDFNVPVTITLEYSPHALGNADETTLALFYWTGSVWSASGIGVVEHDITNHRLIVTIEHLTEFALLGQTASLNVTKAVEGAGEGANGTVNLPPSGVVTYTIVISNNGGGIASSVVVTDPLPPGISFGGWVVTGSAQLPSPGDAIEWGPHDVPAGESYTISFRGIVTSASAFAGQAVTNTAYFSSSNAGFGSSNDAVFTIASANTPPNISDIADQSTYVDTPIAIPFTIEDSETAPDDLNLSVESSNITLVPTATVVFGGLGISRTVTITPTTNLTGMTTITITVSDGEYADDTSFVLTVEPRRVYLPLVVSNHDE